MKIIKNNNRKIRHETHTESKNDTEYLSYFIIFADIYAILMLNITRS